MDAFDREYQDNGEINDENDSSTASSSSLDVASGEDLGRSSIGLTERLTDLFVGGGGEDVGDLSVGRKDGGATTVLQWLQAMDMQMMGACRADERIKPLLKSNGVGGGSDDRLLAHLSQYFEPSEVGLLAMCLCIPLVSMRVGKVLKHGLLLCPTTVRGDLNLVLLPTSDLRLSFVGDDGQSERLFTLGCNSESSAAVIEEIPADSSGRSFLVKSPDSDVYYFWCSEKSKLLGIELLAKMKDLLKTKPSLTELTGISHSRLDCFATHLRAHFSGSPCRATSRSSSNQYLVSPDELGLDTGGEFTTLSSKPLRHRNSANQVLKSSSPCQTSLSPGPTLFKEGMSKNILSLKNVVREKIRRGGGDASVSHLDNFTVSSSTSPQTTHSDPCTQQKHLEVSGYHELPTCSLIETLERVPSSFFSSSTDCTAGLAICNTAFCWCPVESCLTGSLQLPPATTVLRTLPPLSSLLPAARSSSLLTPSAPSMHVASGPTRELPSFLPDPTIRFPFTMPSSQQILTFTPFICDPIVHIPVIDVCSSGQGYLVSAGPGISTTVPPLHSTFVNQMIPQNDMVENGARETLRVLISNSEQSNPPLLDMFSKCDDTKPGILGGGSRGLYSGTCDVDVIANSIAALGMITLSDRSTEVGGYTPRELLPGNHELETSDLDDPFNGTNPSSSLGERNE